MRILKQNSLLRLFNSYLVDSPQPSNISYMWNFGSLLALCLGIQIVTGIFLVMHYAPTVDLAFNSVEHIMREVNYGWLIRYTHANVASFFFIFVYAHTLPLYIKFYFIYVKLSSVFKERLKLKLFKEYLNKILIKPEVLENLIKGIKPIPKLLETSFSSSENKYKNSQEWIDSFDNQFLQWFVGFSDAESSFTIETKNNQEVHFKFSITLHIDDIAVLYTIRNKLGIGVVSIYGTTCSYRVHSFKTILDKILPIFDKYHLLTTKVLNYKDWKKAILLKNLITSSNKDTIFNQITDIKNGMNNSRTNFNGYSVTSDMVSNYWLVGFIEGDGTFYFSNNTSVFGITQKDIKILEAISVFLENIPLSPPFEGLVKPPKPKCVIKNNKNAYQLIISDKDVLFQYIYPFLSNLSFYSRKNIDFSIWSLGLFIFIFGYHNLALGKKILLNLSNNMNSKRYFSNLSDFLDLKVLQELFNIEPPFNIFSGKSHFSLAKDNSKAKGSRHGFKLYIYKNGVAIEGSPFDSFIKGGKAIGLNSVSSIRNYLDTNKVFKDVYTFYSEPKI